MGYLHWPATPVSQSATARKAVIRLERPAILSGDAVSRDRGMVEVEQSLENIMTIRIPMRCNHVGEIVGADVDAPPVPIEKSNVVSTILRAEAIPVMCIQRLAT